MSTAGENFQLCLLLNQNCSEVRSVSPIPWRLINPNGAPLQDHQNGLKPKVEPKLVEFLLEPNLRGPSMPLKIRIFSFFFQIFTIPFFSKKNYALGLRWRVLKPVGISSVSIHTGLEGFLDLEPHSNS